MDYSNVFYFRYLNVIGGIEQFFAYLAEKYKDIDITVVYRDGDKQQLRRLQKYVRTVKFEGQEIHCKKAFYCFNAEIKDKYIKAETSVLMLHGDYKAMVEQGMIKKDCYIFSEQFDEYIGVSQLVCDSWTEMTGKPCKLVYNPFVLKECKKLWKIVYCGRLTDEKGGDLAHNLLQKLDERGIDYIFYVYSNKKEFVGEKVVHMGTRLDAGQFLNKQNFDYILVPSKNEGYCYSLVQALANGLPAIATPCPVFKEIGLNSKNSITLNFDGSNLDEVVDEMLCSNKNFTYKPKQDTWGQELLQVATSYEYNTVSIRATQKYFDLDLQQKINKDEVYDVSEQRAQVIVDKGYAIYEVR